MDTEDSFTVDLTDIKVDNVVKTGNKALNLKLLLKSNLRVPKGYVITTSAYSLFLTRNKIDKLIQDLIDDINYSDYDSILKVSEILRKKIIDSPLPEKLVQEISTKYSHYDSVDVAVRSSATAEDLPTLSFAGQYDTFLNVKTLKQIYHHVKQCYASLWTKRALIYRETNQIPQTGVKIAVIIQKMISVKSSGVMFTANPITNDASETLIESNFGLGESLVSGHINPDQYTAQEIIKKGKKEFRVISKKIGRKEHAVFPKNAKNDIGVETVVLSDQKSRESSLSNINITKLAKIGQNVEKIFGGKPQDIEWALDQDNQINILQSRPITSLKNQIKGIDIIWSRGYSDDYWNDPVTPLFFDILGDNLTKIVNIELNSIMGYKSMEKNLLKLHNGHVYFNLKVLRQKVENEIPKMMRNEDILNYFPDGYGHYGKETILNLPFHLKNRVIAELRIMFHDPNGSITKTAKKYEEWTESGFNPFCVNFDIKFKKIKDTKDRIGLLSLAKELDRVMITHFRLVRYGIPVHNIGMNLLTQYLLNRFLGEKASKLYYPVLISGLKHKLTETNEGIYSIANIIQKNTRLKTILLRKSSGDIYNILLNDKDLQIQEFLNDLESFFKNFGDRGFTREPYYPRWNEKPMVHVFNILKSLSLEDTSKKQKKRKPDHDFREKIEKFIESKIRSQHFGFLKWKIFRTILKISRIYIIFRENQRFNLDRWITRNRIVFLEIGQLLFEEGFLKESSDIFFLKKGEVEQLMRYKFKESEKSKLKDEITKRKNVFLKFENEVPPKFIRGSHEFDDVFKYSHNSVVFKGIPASSGIIVGKIHIIQFIDQISEVQANEILVVPRTDPGWTPVFSKIGGLITETGGILSHGAVVSRECGIPAVTNIPNACKIFKNGQIVRINGYDGTITIKN